MVILTFVVAEGHNSFLPGHLGSLGCTKSVNPYRRETILHITLEGIKICGKLNVVIYQFTAFFYIFQLSCKGARYILTERFNQDPVEAAEN